jgi:hypothetical protein
MAGITEDPGQFADDVIYDAIAAFNRRETKTSDSAALLSIAASLRQMCLQNAAALDGRDQIIALSAKGLEYLERAATPAVPITGELVAGGCYCREYAVPADDLLENAFGLICNVDEGANVPRDFPNQTVEWFESAKKFVSGYNALIAYRYSGSHLPFNTWTAKKRAELDAIEKRAELEEAIARDEIARLKAADDQHADLDAFAAEVDERSAD